VARPCAPPPDPYNPEALPPSHMADLSEALLHLTSLGRSLTGAILPETIATRSADALLCMFEPRAVTVAVEPEPGGDRLDVAATRGAPQIGLDDPFPERCRCGAPAVRSDDGTLLGAPLIAAGHLVGVIVVEGGPDAAYDSADERLLAAVAAQVTIALQNARLLTLLSAGKREWEQMVDAIGAAVCIVDGHGSVHRANRTFAELVATPVTALAGRPWQSLLPPAWWDALSRQLEKPGLSAPCELRDERRLFVCSTIPISGGHAGERTAVLVLEDHTERRLLQQQLIQSEKMSAIGQLISGVAHELNNPLASVLGFADFLLDGGEVPAPLAEPLRVIQQEAQRAAGIVKNLLTFARKQDQGRRPVAVGEILERTVALLRSQFLQLRVDAELVVDRDLPDVAASPNQLQQVFLNILNNAAHAIAGAGRPGTIKVHARRWLDGVAVDVSDTGPGIAPEIAERIFEPFFTTKREGEGTGLGLSICQGIVKEHGGRLSLQSKGGSGATFTVELPAAPAEAAVESAAEADQPFRARVLVVDDEPHVLYYMRATLEAWGHSVEVASDGEEGLRRALAEPFDLIFTDVRMPGKGGREFFEALRETAPDTASRVVFATGDTVSGDTLTFLGRSGRPVLHKPFKIAELRATLGAALRAR